MQLQDRIKVNYLKIGKFLCAMLRILILKAFKMAHTMHYIITKQGTHSSDFFVPTIYLWVAEMYL